MTGILKSILLNIIVLFLAFFLGSGIHEIGHLIFLKIYDIDAFNFRIAITEGALFKFSHAPVSDDFTLAVIRYSGGLSAAVFLIIFYYLYRKWFDGKISYGIILFIIIGLELASGILEGEFNQEYFSYGPVRIVAEILAVVGGALFFIYLNRKKIALLLQKG